MNGNERKRKTFIGDIRPAGAGQRATGAGRGRARVRNFAAERVKAMAIEIGGAS